MKKALLFIVSSLISLNLVASIPTVEGLFRNGANPDLNGDTVAINMMISETRPNEELNTAETIESYYKLIFGVTKGAPLRMIQVRYIDSALNTNQVVAVRSFENFRTVIADDSAFERVLAHSLVLMHALNDSSGFNSLLKRYSRGYLSNNELVNQDKRRIYGRYKDHMREKQDGPSPLSPTDPEDKKALNEIMAARFYEDTKKVKMIRQGGEFFWEVNLDTFKAQFDHSTRQLRRMSINTFQGQAQIDIGPYAAVNGTFEMPAFVLIRYEDGRQSRISFSGYQDFNSRNKRFQERISDYQKFMQQSLQRISSEQVSSLPVVRYMY